MNNEVNANRKSPALGLFGKIYYPVLAIVAAVLLVLSFVTYYTVSAPTDAGFDTAAAVTRAEELAGLGERNTWHTGTGSTTDYAVNTIDGWLARTGIVEQTASRAEPTVDKDDGEDMDITASYSAKMDAYYADVYASRPEILCTVYGYDAYVCGERMAALAVTDGEKAKSEAADIVASFGKEGSDAVRGITALASYAEYGDASAVADGARGIYDSLSAAADGEEDDFPKAFVRYKLYRLAAAMAGAGESGWAGDAEDAYGAWSATINAIKNV